MFKVKTINKTANRNNYIKLEHSMWKIHSNKIQRQLQNGKFYLQPRYKKIELIKWFLNVANLVFFFKPNSLIEKWKKSI